MEIKKPSKKPFIIAGAALALAIIIVTSLFIMNRNRSWSESSNSGANSLEKLAEPDPVYYSRLSGELVASKADETATTTCVMIENSPAARPQSGLSQADLVYEAIAEGGITRFLAIFQNKKPALVGPVRSVRMYYVDWLTPYNCSVAHAGGADDALAVLRDKNNGYRDIDQFFQSKSYWRSPNRYAPHNLYTNFEKLDALNAKLGYNESVFEGFPRLEPDQAPAENDTSVNSISIPISSALYNSNYTYNPDIKTYLRSHQSGGAHFDRDASGNSVQNAPKVVIAMMVSQSLASDRLHQKITTIDSGNAYIFQNGQITIGKWSKNAKASEIKFTDENGDTIKFVPGQIWITAVPNNKKISWQ